MFSPRRMSSACVLRDIPVSLGLLLLLIGPALWAAQQPAGGSSRYVGPETCQACHEDAYQSFAVSPHKILSANTEVAKQGCEACHGPGAEHVSGNGDASKIFRFGNARPVAIRSHCVACHTRIGEDPHSRHGVTCLSCHSAHHYTQAQFILIKAEDSLCRGCHPPEARVPGKRR